MGQLRSMFRGVAMDDAIEPDAAVDRLNELAIARPRARAVRPGWLDDAHVVQRRAPTPMLIRPGHATQPLTAGAGMALGVARGFPRPAGRVRVDAGCTLLL